MLLLLPPQAGVCQAYPALTREGREVQIGSGTEAELCDFAQVSTLSEPPIPEGDPGRPCMQRERNAMRGKAPETSTETVIHSLIQ